MTVLLGDRLCLQAGLEVIIQTSTRRADLVAPETKEIRECPIEEQGNMAIYSQGIRKQ